MPSPFIVLDGPDGSGTTYHTAALAERLKAMGKDVLLAAEPSDGSIGAWIRMILKDGIKVPPEALQLLFCADRAWHADTIIKPAFESDQIVICDRYVPSTIAYGAATGVDTEWLKEINAHFLPPTRTILLRAPVDVCMQRLDRRTSRDLFEHRALQEKVHAAYDRIAGENPSIRAIDSSGDKNETAEKIWESVKNLFA